MHTDKKDSDRSTVSSWSPEPAKLNSAFSKVARRSVPSAPATCTISQDTLRRWEHFSENSLWCVTRQQGYPDDLPRYKTLCWHTWRHCIRTEEMARRHREHSKLLNGWSIWLLSTEPSPKPCNVPCRICLKAFLSACQTTIWHVETATWSIYVVGWSKILLLPCVLHRSTWHHCSLISCWLKLKMRFPVVRRAILLAAHIGSPVAFTLTLPQLQNQHTNRTESPLYLLWSRSGTGNTEEKDRARPQLSTRNWLRVPSRVNDNYCVQSVVGLKDSVYVSGK